MGETTGQKPLGLNVAGSLQTNLTTQTRFKVVAGSRLAHHPWAILLPQRIHSQSDVYLPIQTDLLVFNLIVQGAGWK